MSPYLLVMFVPLVAVCNGVLTGTHSLADVCRGFLVFLVLLNYQALCRSQHLDREACLAVSPSSESN